MSQLTLARDLPHGFRPRIRPGALTPRPTRLRVVNAMSRDHNHSAFALLCLALVLAGLLSALMLNMARAESSYVLGDLRGQSTELHDQRVTLQAELAGVSSPEALARQAQELGLVPSPSTAVLRLSDGRMLGVASAVDPERPFSVITHASNIEEISTFRRVQDALAAALQGR